MVSIMEIMQFCRLCLVKEQVNVPIFDEQEDIRQICEKITSCLPVKVSKEDELPKKICDGCLYKLELQYQFYNSTANAEKQLLTWLEQAKMDSKNSSSEITTSQTTVKQEKVEPIESTNEITEITEITTDPQSYMQQYQTDFQYKDSQVSNADIDANVSSNSDEPLAKRARRRRQASKPIPREVIESSDENDAGDSMMEMTVTKTEEESESDNEENVDDPEPAKYAAAGEDTEQPGPSGLGKGGTDAPFTHNNQIKMNYNDLPAADICNSLDVQIKHEPEDYPAEIEEDASKNIDLEDEEDLLTRLRRLRDYEKAIKMRSTEAIQCEVCDKTFKNSLDFGLHSIAHSADKKYHCFMCKYASGSLYHFEMHIKAHEGNTKYKCEICNKAFTVSTHAAEHKYFHTGEKPFQCEICGKHFMFSWFLTSHRRSQHWEIMTGTPLVKYDCTICNKHYTSSTGLKRHQSSKHYDSEKTAGSVLCDVCGKRLASMEKLKFHSRIHTGYKPFACAFCAKAFSRKEQVKEHERVHTGEKPYICRFCGKGFTQRSPLRIHERTHTGERPYTCRLCNKGFISKGVMDTHMKNCRGQ